MTKPKPGARPMFRFTPEQLQALASRYPHEKTSVLAAEFGCAEHTITGAASRRGIRKSAEWLEAQRAIAQAAGKNTRFKKGHVSWNKGKPMPSTGRSASTQFKAGHMPHNHLPVGAQITDTDGYLKTKTAEPNQWEFTHRLIWQTANGEIPKGQCLVFKDGNRAHVAIENLEVISRTELMKRNTIHRYPENLKEVMRLKGQVKKAVRKRQKAQPPREGATQ